MTAKTTEIAPIVGADEGYYITPNGVVLRAVAISTGDGGWAYRSAKIRKGGKQKTRLVHRMVAEAFVPNPDNKPQVNHKNGDKLDNRAENLEWVTPGENTRHAHKLGLAGKRNLAVDMMDTDGHFLRRFNSLTEAGEYCGVKKPCNISKCINGKQKTAYGFIWKQTRRTP